MKKSQARVAARTAGDKTYVPEDPCARGHSLRGVSTGSCIACRAQTARAAIENNRTKYNARKKRERMHRLPEIAAKAKATRANETPTVRAARLETAKIRQRAWRVSNPRHVGSTISKKNYKMCNPEKVRADCVYRRLSKMRRTPAWLTADDLWLIEQAYEIAGVRTRMFGFSWHVDHIIPLQGVLISGLHVPTNLQVIPGVDNVRKANRFIPA